MVYTAGIEHRTWPMMATGISKLKAILCQAVIPSHVQSYIISEGDNTLETIKITDSKRHMIHRTAPFPMTLSDLQGHSAITPAHPY